MNSLRINPPEELQHLFEDEIYDYMIGESPSSYVGGLGTGPKLRPLFWIEKLTTVKAELAEMRSNFNEQLLEIQAQIRDCFKRYLVRDFIGL
ncbi:hypothetical protein ACOSP7_009824 [Xanthoceras sorbifolium]